MLVFNMASMKPQSFYRLRNAVYRIQMQEYQKNVRYLSLCSYNTA